MARRNDQAAPRGQDQTDHFGKGNDSKHGRKGIYIAVDKHNDRLYNAMHRVEKSEAFSQKRQFNPDNIRLPQQIPLVCASFASRNLSSDFTLGIEASVRHT